MDVDVDVDSALVEEFRNLNREDKEFSKKCTKVVSDIEQGALTIVQLVEQLKTLLVDTSPENRELGMYILSQILKLLPDDYLASSQLNFICAFYSDRLNDHHHVIPSTLKGMLVLIQLKNLPEGCTKQLLGSLFQNVPCQQQQQGDRHNIYKILENCVEKRFTELQQMGVDFVYGVISAMDGERDPRNLLYLFSWLPKFVKNFDLGHLTEEMFEVMACYFPVDFRAPPQDPNSISRETLAAALGTCLGATPQFAEFCLPLALEKLSSSLRIAKLDSLNVLTEGCKTFEVSAYIQHSTDIWSQIQREIFNCNDEELVEVALRTLEAVMNKLSQSAENIYIQILSDITDTLKGNLMPSMKLYIPSCKMLHYVAKASKTSANYLTSEIVPTLINTYNITMTPSHQVLVFKNLIDFVRIYINVHQDDNITETKELSGIPSLCLKAALDNNDDVRATGLLSLALIAKSLPFDIRKCLYENLSVMLITSQSKIVRVSVFECFKEMALTYSVEVQNYVLESIKISNSQSLSLYLESLEVIVDQEEYSNTVLPIFIEYCISDIDTAEIATKNLRNLLENHEDNEFIQKSLVEKGQVISKLTDWVFNYLNLLDVNIEKHRNLLENINAIYKLIIGHQNSKVQHELIQPRLEKMLQLYNDGHKSILIIIFDGLLTRVHKDVKIGQDIADDLFEVALNSNDTYVKQFALQLLSNILNKTSDEEKLEKTLSKIMNIYNNILQNVETNDKIINVINIISWVTKALVMRGYEGTELWTEKMFELLQKHKEAAKGFQIVMKNNYNSLSNKSYCNIRLLYRQRFFTESITELAENYKEENPNYLLAIGYLLQEAPKQVFIMQFNKTFRLVILCLEQCEDAEVLCAVLDTLCSLIQSKESLTEEHLQEFIPRFLKLTSFKSSMQVRIKALQCLQHYTVGYPVYKLLPLKQDVIHNLTPCLDDKKRLVRKEAVETRLLWFMLDAPT